MSVAEKANELLHQIYNVTITDNHRAFIMMHDKFCSLTQEQQRSLLNSKKYLEDRNLIEPFGLCIGMVMSHRLTANGIDTIEKNQNEKDNHAVVINNYVKENKGVVAGTASNNTINNFRNYNFSDIENVIEEMKIKDDEKAMLKEQFRSLYDCMEKGYPLKKGMLENVRDYLEKFQPLYSAVLQSVLSFLVSAK